MAARTWSRDEAVRRQDSLTIDELDSVGVLVLDGVGADDDALLAWCLRAPCVVVARTPPGCDASRVADIVVDATDEGDDLVGRLVRRVDHHRQASRMLVNVLRATTDLDVAPAVVVESLAYSLLLGGREFGAWLAAQPVRVAKSFAGPPVRVDRVGGQLSVTLSRPENRNAFSAAMRDALFETLALAEYDETVEAVVLSGEGPAFSSGGDLTEFGSATDLPRAHEIRTLRSVAAVINRLAPKTTALVHGTCVGAGTELSAFAGHVVARPGTTFRLPEVSMGLIPGAGGTVSLPRRIGRQRTAQLAILDEEINLDTALAWGLVDAVVDPDRPATPPS